MSQIQEKSESTSAYADEWCYVNFNRNTRDSLHLPNTTEKELERSVPQSRIFYPERWLLALLEIKTARAHPDFRVKKAKRKGYRWNVQTRLERVSR